jgi:hypothetical protein
VIVETFFDVRAVLSADKIGDSKWSMLELGRAAASAVIEWLGSEDPPREEELAERIPFLPRPTSTPGTSAICRRSHSMRRWSVAGSITW